MGELRFRDPVEPEPWNGVLDATHPAPRPMQDAGTGLEMEPWKSDFYYAGNPPMSEDCLYLSVATGAAKAGEDRPVYMWFHGGGLASGYSTEIEFDPAELARKGIVVVSVGQRLNVFGYLALPALSAEQGGISGNYGLKDEFMALRWVKENLAFFGGDPENVTLGGQSGGTAKSTALATSPMARGMVRRVVNQSNLAWARNYRPLAEAEADGREYLRNLGLDPDLSPEELRRIPAFRYYRMLRKPEGFGAPGGLPGSMAADGVWIKSTSAMENMAEFAGGIDFLSGGNLGESSLRDPGLMPGKGFRDAADFYGFMREKLGALSEGVDLETLWPVNDENVNFRSRELAARAFSGGHATRMMGGVITNRYFGAFRAARGCPARTYSYLFARFPPSLPEEEGTFRAKDNLLAWHSSELWYTFASLRKGTPPCRPWEETDFLLADKMSSYGANFIRTGDPNGEGLPFWPESRENFGW
ncbi:MAG: carboxylesterase family protein, partial [Clostridia bacterium]|nr:carboxylesterase family protein [Clostridia bacterium]